MLILQNFADPRLLGRVQPQDPAAAGAHNERGLLPLAVAAAADEPRFLEEDSQPPVLHPRGGGQEVPLPALRGQEERLLCSKCYQW